MVQDLPCDLPYDDLVRQAQQADEDERRQLLDKLVTQFAEAAFHWARVILEDEDKAHDALQEAWLNAYLHFDQLRESAAFPAWFRQIVISACYHAIRGETPSVPLPEQLTTGAARQPDPVEEVENNERLERVREAVLALPERERIVTELFYFADYPQQEIAEVLDVPVTTVKKRLQYARRHLKGLIRPEAMLHVDLYALNYALNGGCTADALTTAADEFLEWVPVAAFAVRDPLMERVP